MKMYTYYLQYIIYGTKKRSVRTYESLSQTLLLKFCSMKTTAEITLRTNIIF